VARQAPKGRAPARERRQTRADEQRARRAEQLEGFRSEQEHHAAILRGDGPDKEMIEADHGFRESWAAQQRLIYPEIYRVADMRLAEGGEPSAQPGTPLGLFGDHPIGLEPGHDPTLQRRYRELDEEIAEALEETAGEDNQPPGANRVTTVPAEAGDDDSVTPPSVRGAKDEADAKREEARAGK
jgi:hypothetical protein